MNTGSLPRIFTALSLGAFLLAGVPAQAALFNYQFTLDGPSEAPPNNSAGTGFGLAVYDSTAHTLAINMSFTGLTGTTTAAHIHGATAVAGTGTAGVMTTTPSFPLFPLGVTSGAFSNTFNLTLASSYNSTFITGNGGTVASAEAAMIAAFNAGKAYFNVHSTFRTGGEIRGFLTPVPEPTTAVFGIALTGLMLAGRRRNRTVTLTA